MMSADVFKTMRLLRGKNCNIITNRFDGYGT